MNQLQILDSISDCIVIFVAMCFVYAKIKSNFITNKNRRFDRLEEMVNDIHYNLMKKFNKEENEL